MKYIWSRIFKFSIRLFPSYIYSKKLNKIKNCLARKSLKYVKGQVNFGKNIRMSLDISIGARSGIGDNAVLNGPITIDDNVMMGPNVVVYRSNHETKRTDLPMIDQGMT